MEASDELSTTPVLAGAALDAVRYRGGHLQIIAAAGSGKTEVVSQRVADLLADGFAAESIVAFTFTERAAEELENRIARRVQDRLGRASLDRLTSLFVGTIHSYCFRLLQQHVPRYETYGVLDDNQLTAFLSREATRLPKQQVVMECSRRKAALDSCDRSSRVERLRHTAVLGALSPPGLGCQQGAEAHPGPKAANQDPEQHPAIARPRPVSSAPQPFGCCSRSRRSSCAGRGGGDEHAEGR